MRIFWFENKPSGNPGATILLLVFFWSRCYNYKQDGKLLQSTMKKKSTLEKQLKIPARKV
jgi:hypothetical protein